MAQQLTCKKRHRLNESGKRVGKVIFDFFVQLWKDERGMWSMILCLFIIIIAIPFLYFVQDAEDARYVRDAAYSATDAASVAGACQSVQQGTSFGSYGQMTSYVMVVDQPRATDHAEATLLKNMQNLTSQGVALVSYSITYPAQDQVRVDATVHYTASHVSKALQLFFGPTQEIGTDINVHATSLVGQPSS